MSKVCEICGKKPMYGHMVSHANNKTNRRFLPNLKKVSIIKNGAKKALKVCMKCLKAGKVAA